MVRARSVFCVVLAGLAVAGCGKKRAPFAALETPTNGDEAGAPSSGAPDPGGGDGVGGDATSSNGAGGDGQGPSDGSAGSGGGSTTLGGSLTRILKGGPWQLGQTTTGFVVDHQGRLYVSDQETVYVVNGTKVSQYLSTEDVAAITGDLATQTDFTDLDIGEDDSLYVGARGKIVKSTGAHTGTLWGNFGDAFSPYPASFEEKFSVLSDDALVITEEEGLYRIEHDKASRIYRVPPEEPSWSTDCTCHDFAAARDGTFVFLPGCNGSSLIQGTADGSGTSVLYITDYDGKQNPLRAANFTCATRKPGGGFYVVSQSYATDYQGPHLYYLSEKNGQISGASAVATVPSLRQAWQDEMHDEPFVFDFCSLAAGEDGTIYLQSMSQLWRIDP